MIRFFKLRQDLLDPAPARDVYVKPGPGKGWPDECPPIRAAQGFGFDLLANFRVTFHRKTRGWVADPDLVIQSDFDYAATEEAPGAPLLQQYAWFWKKGQKLPHPISDNVYRVIRNQVKLSTFLYFQSDPNELLLLCPVPNLRRKWWTWSSLVETDWYPSSHPLHVVLELDPSERKITIEKGEPLARVVPVRRDTYFAAPMSPEEFDRFFQRGQTWLATHGRAHESAEPGQLDITRTYVRQQVKSRFIVMK
jgi:hypothetical protein